jgi:transposase-like protein
MTNLTTGIDSFAPATETAAHLFDNWFDPIESGIEELIRCELDAALARPRYGRAKKADSGLANLVGHRHGSRTRSLTGSFGETQLTVPRARLQTRDGNTTEWHSQVLRSYQRRTLTADALIASAYLAGTNTRRVRRALAALFRDGVSKDIVSRVWRKIKSDWDAWNARSLTDEPMVRLILDGTVVRVRLDRKSTAISLLVVIGVHADGQKVLLAVKHMGGESAEAWRSVLDDLIRRGLRRPEFLIVDGAPGLEKAIAAVWDGVPVQRCTVHKHRNMLAHAPERMHEEIGADYTDMIYAATPEDIAMRRKGAPRGRRQPRRSRRSVVHVCTFAADPMAQRADDECDRTAARGVQAPDQNADRAAISETAAMLFWALLASGQINMRRVDGWQTLATTTIDQPIDLAA